ncbi:MAG: MBL fold metallo-hydrolase [Burkholderiaceae bacterium]
MSGAAQKLPGTIRFLERDWLSSNNVLMFDGEQASLFDTGYYKHAELTDQLVSTLLADNTRLTRIINTHLHSDHCGGNATLFARHQCQILVPEACVASVQDWTEQAQNHQDLAQWCERFPVHRGVSPGEVIHAGALDWVAHAAPGHDPTSLIFFNEQHRILISADALWENGFGVIFPEVFGESGFAEQAAVLDLIESLDPLLVIPGHGRVFDTPAAALKAARQRLDALVKSPQRSHRNALKVMIKFLLLDKEQMTVPALHQLTQETRIFLVLCELLEMQSPEQATDWAIEQLIRQSELTRNGDLICNA